LPNVIKIDPYNFELYCFKVCAFFLRHSVVQLTKTSMKSTSEIVKAVKRSQFTKNIYHGFSNLQFSLQ